MGLGFLCQISIENKYGSRLSCRYSENARIARPLGVAQRSPLVKGNSMIFTQRFALASLCLGGLLAIMPGAAAQELALSPHASLPSGIVDFPLDKKYEDFTKLMTGSHEYDGLFKLHLKEDRLYAEIMPHQFDRPLLCPIAVARGMA